MIPLQQWAYLIRLIVTVPSLIDSWLRSVITFFSSGSMGSILQHYKSYAGVKKLPGQYQTDFFVFCDTSIFFFSNKLLLSSFREN